MSKNELNLTPFEMARINIQKTAENFSIYESIEMLAASLDNLIHLSDEDRKDIESLAENVIKQMSRHLEDNGAKWN